MVHPTDPPVPAHATPASPDPLRAAPLEPRGIVDTWRFGSLQEQFALAVDLARVAVWRYDLATGAVRFTDRAFEMLGMPVSPSSTLSIVDLGRLTHPEDLPVINEATRQVIETGQPSETTARYRHTDGTWRHVLARRTLQRDLSGAPIAVLGVSLDISSQVEGTRQAVEATRRFELSAAAAGLGVWEMDLRSLRMSWNTQMYALHALDTRTPAPAHDQWVDWYLHPDDRAAARERANAFGMGQRDSADSQFRIVLPDGSERWVLDRAHVDRSGDTPRVLGVTMDITARVKAESELRKATERAALAARSVGVGTWERNLFTGEAVWDEQMYLLRGLEPSVQAPDKATRDALVHPEDLQRISSTVDEAALRGGAASYEFRVRLPDGSWRWLASRSSIIRDEAGRPARQIGVNWDTTAAREAEIARQEREVAQRENQAKSEFLARMSHELRTPLNAVLGFTQLLLTEKSSGDPARMRKRLEHVRDAGEHLLSLINDVLDLSRLEAHQARFELERLPLRTVVDEALPLVEPMSRKHGVTVYTGQLGGAVLADRIRMRQVLVNLLSNAIKYNRPQGTVFIEAHSSRDEMMLTVRDTGRGMTEEQLAHLYEPFNRLGVQREGIEGTGIGLTIARTIVERMGGHLEVRSTPGVGSEFTAVLRAARASADEASRGATSTTSQPPVAAVRGSVLYIEDNPVNVLIIEELLSRRPAIRFESAGDGTQGVHKAIELRPDLVLVDMQLPDFDGIEVLRRLRAESATERLPCIALSANAMPEDIERALAAGFADYWTKPVDFEAFMQAIDRLFGNPA